jgi:hypothetical protein
MFLEYKNSAQMTILTTVVNSYSYESIMRIFIWAQFGYSYNGS